MADSTNARQDSTLRFLPTRLNRQPVIVRGLTANELWITVGLSGGCGLALGVGLAVIFRSIPMAPATVVATVTVGIFLGGGALRRYKRGRPDTWLYRQIEWSLCRSLPSLRGRLGFEPLILRSGYWTTRRTRRRRASRE